MLSDKKEIKLNRNKWQEHTRQNAAIGTSDTAPSQSNDHGISTVRNNLISVTLYLCKKRKKITKQSPIY